MYFERIFADRTQAGRELAIELESHRGENVVVLALPRGGAPVAFEVARALHAPLDVCVVRKLGAPMQPELGVGAVAEDGVVVVDGRLAATAGMTEAEVTHAVERKKHEVEERVRRYRRGAPGVDVRDTVAIVIDDGVATGGTARAAIRTLRGRGARRVVLAVPVGAAQTLRELAREADEVVCPFPKEHFRAVGLWYEDFTPTTDEDVATLLARARREHEREEAQRRRSGRVPAAMIRDVFVPIGAAPLEGRLTIPANAGGLVVFAHGSGSTRHSWRNRFVAGELEKQGLATLLFDLLTPEEEQLDASTGRLRFDIELLAGRLIGVTDWARQVRETQTLPLGFFGASTGAAAALVAAARRPDTVRAVVSRGGRPDLAGAYLGDVRAPTLLIVGGDDAEALRRSREALLSIGTVKELEIVPGATHLFEEPGALEHVARSAARWFVHHLVERAARAIA